MVTNIAAYKFARLDHLKELRPQLLDYCQERALKGTILLAPEGVNLFVAGGAREIDELLERLRALPGLEALSAKVSYTDEQPFARMLVRLKREIIAFGVDSVDPNLKTSPRLSAQTLKNWLDEGKPLILLDTRNDYEVRVGTFRNAVPIGIDRFRDFPAAARQLPDHLKEMPVVTFCTGGIRCEKAAPLLEQLGFQEVWQLEGGILKYFEDVGADHYEGDCFVFDRRVGVDPALAETDVAVCFACQTPLTVADQADPRYLLGTACPHCHRDEEELRLSNLTRREEALRQISRPLPGSVPAHNSRPLRIPGRLDGRTLAEALRQLFPQLAAEVWIELEAAADLRTPSGEAARLDQVVRAGEQYERLDRCQIEPDVNPAIRVIYEDQALLVVDKPAPLPTHPCGRFNRNTLRYLLQRAWAPESPRPAHRLDANTTGVLLCARSHHFAKILQPMFARGQIEKTYLARIHGHPIQDSFTIDMPIGDVKSEAGLRDISEGKGRPSFTLFQVLEKCADGTSLLEVQPITGRTNQIRAHLWQAGHPIVGDVSYLPGGISGERQTLEVGEPPMQLHCWKLSLLHPISSERVTFSSLPDWLAQLPSNSASC